jgi:hypothetical protein
MKMTDFGVLSSITIYSAVVSGYTGLAVTGITVVTTNNHFFLFNLLAASFFQMLSASCISLSVSP